MWKNYTMEEELNNNEYVEKDKYLRLASDFENYKRRSIKEKDLYIKSATQKILLDILPTIDNFERAVNLDSGIMLIYTNLKNVLFKNGITEIETNGLDFNSDTMEAISQILVDNMSNKVIEVVEKGYMLNGIVIRYSKVVVGI